MQEYSITVPDGMETTVLLSDEDAKRAGLLSNSGSKAKTADPDKVDAKAATPANKASVPENKGS